MTRDRDGGVGVGGGWWGEKQKERKEGRKANMGGGGGGGGRGGGERQGVGGEEEGMSGGGEWGKGDRETFFATKWCKSHEANGGEKTKKKPSREPIKIALSNPICHFQYKVYVIFINRKEKTELWWETYTPLNISHSPVLCHWWIMIMQIFLWGKNVQFHISLSLLKTEVYTYMSIFE